MVVVSSTAHHHDIAWRSHALTRLHKLPVRSLQLRPQLPDLSREITLCTNVHFDHVLVLLPLLLLNQVLPQVLELRFQSYDLVLPPSPLIGMLGINLLPLPQDFGL